MNPMKKIVLKILSYPHISVKKYYKLYRKVLIASSLHRIPLYQSLDYKITYKNRDIPIRVFKANKQNSRRVLLFFHGGGWVTGNIDTYTNICSHMANITNSTVISVDYRLAPEHPFPAGLEDCYHVAKELYLHPEMIQCSCDDITVVGDSAGGNLAAVVSLMARDYGDFIPTKQILLYPTTNNDYSEQSPFPSIHENGTNYGLTRRRIEEYMELYAPNTKDKDSPYVAPLLCDNLENQPKTLIITAEYDLLRDEGECYGNRLKESGNDVTIYRIKEALHGFLSMPKGSKVVNECYQQINHFLYDEYEMGTSYDTQKKDSLGQVR